MSVVAGYWLEGGFPFRRRDFSLLYSVQKLSGTHPASHPNDVEGSVLKSKAAVA
jgi:hypothetical protein